MRVGLLAYGLSGAPGGIGRYTVELATALSSLAQDLELVFLAAGDARPLAHLPHASSEPLPGCRLLPGLVSLGNLQVPRAASKRALDVVHDPTGVTPLLFGAARARTVVTLHDVFAWSCPGTSTLLDRLIYRRWLPYLAPRVDQVLTDSRASQADIVRYLRVPPDRIRVVYAGVSAAYRPLSGAAIALARARYSLPERYLLYVGSLGARKNLPRLLEAYAQLRREGETRPLVVAGPRRWTPRLSAAIAALGLAEAVRLAGYVSEPDLPALYSGADLFVFPSLYEGFGLPPLEAMACGTPVVCSNTSSLPEVVGDAALTVDPYDVPVLADAMQRVLADEALRAVLRARGLERAHLFTWERAARETVATYHEALGR